MASNFSSDGKMIFSIFIGAIITIVFLSSIADSVNLQTNTRSVANETVTSGAVNVSVDVTGRDLIGLAVIKNATNSTAIDLEGTGVNVITGINNGIQTVQLIVNDTGSNFAGQPLNLSYTYNPDGFVTDSGARSIVLLIVIFGALAIVVTVIAFLFRGSLANLLTRN